MIAAHCASTGTLLNAVYGFAQMLHAFLPPVDVELSVQFGGHTETGSDL
jgi:hypothetical protein